MSDPDLMLTPPDLASRLGVSLRSVYNYLEKYKNRIKKSKKGNKTFYCLFDLEKILNDVNNLSDPEYNNSVSINNSESIQALKSDLENLKEENTNLSKFNNNLQDNANKYALALKEEKEEKKIRLNKYTDIQAKYENALTSFNKERVVYERKIYILIWIIAVAITCIVFLIYGSKIFGKVLVG